MLIVPWSDVVLEVNKSYVISHVFNFLLLSYMIHVQFNLFLRLKISSSAHVDKLSFATLAVQPLHSMFLMSPGQPFSEVLLRMRYIYLAFFAFGHIVAKWNNMVKVGTLTCEGLAVNQRGVAIPVVHVTISKHRTTMDLLYSWPYVPARTMGMTEWVGQIFGAAYHRRLFSFSNFSGLYTKGHIFRILQHTLGKPWTLPEWLKMGVDIPKPLVTWCFYQR